MSDYKLTREEVETCINFDDASPNATIYSCKGSIIRRMEKLQKMYPEQVKLITEDTYSKTFSLPKKWVSKIRAPKQISDEQREKLRERLKTYHEEKKNNK